MAFLQKKSVRTTTPQKLSMLKGSSAFNSPIPSNLKLSCNDDSFIDSHFMDSQSHQLNDVSQQMIEQVSAMNISSSKVFEAIIGSPLSNDDNTSEFIISTPSSSNRSNSAHNKRKMSWTENSSIVHTPTTVRDVLKLSPPPFIAQGTKKHYVACDSYSDPSRTSRSNKRQRRSIIPIRAIARGNKNKLSNLIKKSLQGDSNLFKSSNPTLPLLDDDPIIYSPNKLAAKRWELLSPSLTRSFRPISLPLSTGPDDFMTGKDMGIKCSGNDISDDSHSSLKGCNNDSTSMRQANPASFSEPTEVNLRKNNSFVAVVSDSSRSSTPESFGLSATSTDLKHSDTPASKPGKYFGLDFFDKTTMCRFPRHRRMRSQRSDRHRPVHKLTPKISSKSTTQEDLDIPQF